MSGARPSEAPRPRRPTFWARVLPILYFELYLNFTVVLFAFGPWPWPVKNPVKLYGFLACAHLALLLGYMCAAFRRPAAYNGRWTVEGVVKASLIVSALLLLPTVWFRTGAILPDLGAALADLGRTYEETNRLRAEGKPFVEYVRIAFGLWLSWLLPLSVFYWKRLGAGVRIASLSVIGSSIVMWIALGTNKGIGDVVLLIPAMLVAGHLSGISRLSLAQAVALAVVVGLLAVGFVTFFSAAIASRQRSDEVSDTFAVLDIRADPSNVFMRYVPRNMQSAVRGLAMYLNVGYYGLSLALEKPFLPTWGVGSSPVTIRQAERFLGEGSVARRTYPYQIEMDGWDANGLWSSFYPWIASDVSFPGTIVVVFLVGYNFGLAWVDSLRGANPFAVAMAANFVIMLYYFPSNNQLFYSMETGVASIVTFVLWRLSRKTPREGSRR